jgi:hypothetical protein
VQIAQAHRDPDYFGTRLADLVDHLRDRHRRAELDGDITHAEVLEPIGKTFNAEIVNAFADRSNHDSTFLVVGI